MCTEVYTQTDTQAHSTYMGAHTGPPPSTTILSPSRSGFLPGPSVADSALNLAVSLPYCIINYFKAWRPPLLEGLGASWLVEKRFAMIGPGPAAPTVGSLAKALAPPTPVSTEASATSLARARPFQWPVTWVALPDSEATC